jgi:hypothetical protein
MIRYGIDAYRVIYQTVNATGQAVRASGLVVFPAAGPRQLRLVSFATGPDTYKLGVPSTFGLDAATDGLEGRWSSELFGSAGFAVAEPDYAGMGQGSGPIELMVARSMATASLDVLTAARALAARHSYPVDPGVLAADFSGRRLPAGDPCPRRRRQPDRARASQSVRASRPLRLGLPRAAADRPLVRRRV